MMSDPRPIRDVLDSGASGRYAKLTPAQRDAVDAFLEVAHAYVRDEVSLDDARRQTIGGYLRWRVTSVLVSGTEDYAVWMKFVTDLASGQETIVDTRFGPFSQEELLGDRKRYRVKWDNIEQREVEVWEQQYCEDGVFYWPSERPPERLNPRRYHAAHNNVHTIKQMQAWDDPENPPDDL